MTSHFHRKGLSSCDKDSFDNNFVVVAQFQVISLDIYCEGQIDKSLRTKKSYFDE